MRIEYIDDEIKKVCTDIQYAYRKLGKSCSRKLFRKLQMIIVMDNLQEFYDTFSSWRPHPLKGDLLGFHAFDLDGPTRIIYHPANICGKYCDSNTDYKIVNCIIIKEVSKHYGD